MGWPGGRIALAENAINLRACAAAIKGPSVIRGRWTGVGRTVYYSTLFSANICDKRAMRTFVRTGVAVTVTWFFNVSFFASLLLVALSVRLHLLPLSLPVAGGIESIQIYPTKKIVQHTISHARNIHSA